MDELRINWRPTSRRRSRWTTRPATSPFVIVADHAGRHRAAARSAAWPLPTRGMPAATSPGTSASGRSAGLLGTALDAVRHPAEPFAPVSSIATGCPAPRNFDPGSERAQRTCPGNMGLSEAQKASRVGGNLPALPQPHHCPARPAPGCRPADRARRHAQLYAHLQRRGAALAGGRALQSRLGASPRPSWSCCGPSPG